MVDPEDVSDEELAAEVESLQDDETVDFDSETRPDDAGWLKMYVECPDCEVPMARTAIEAVDVETPSFVTEATTSEYRAVCPDCGVYATHVTVESVTAEMGEVDRAQSKLSRLGETLFDVVTRSE